MVIWERSAQRDLARLDKQQAARVIDAVDRLDATGAGDVKALRGEGGVMRLRVGDYRVRLRVEGETVRVLHVAHRREAYR